ncbi:flagellin [Methylorubrum populi]|nr:flagellin [Methylorubrum populi]
MTSLLTNISAMTALTTLKGINSQLDATSNRVSTGQRVSAASDNAAYWSIATTVRTDNASLSAVKDSLGLGASAVDTAYNGLNSILADLQNLRAKLQTALQPGVDRAKVQTEIKAIQDKMRSTADSSTSSGQNWLSVDSSASNTSYQATQNVVAGFSRSPTGTVSFSMIGVDVNAIKLYDVSASSQSTPATNARLTGRTGLWGSPAFASGTADFSGNAEVAFRITSSGLYHTIVLNMETMTSAAKDLARVTPEEFVNAINNQIASYSTSPPDVAASFDEAGRLRFDTQTTGANTFLIVDTGTITSGKVWRDVGFSNNGGTALYRPMVLANSSYANIDLSGANTKSISFFDGTTTTTVTLNAASLPAPANPASVTFSEIRNMLNANLAAQGSSIGFGSSSGPGYDFLVLYGSGSGPSAQVIVGGPDAGAFGFVAGQSGTGSVDVGSSFGPTARGSDPGVVSVRGLLDSADGGTGMSIAAIDISGLAGTTGDATLSAIITQVEKAIARATDAGTRLGANKTQIDGQKAFIDSLMKANERTTGILVDADIEEESTKLKALQTQQQLAVQALSIANSSSQTILTLFRQ